MPLFLFLYNASMPPLRQKQIKQSRSAISDDIKRQICEWEEANKNKRHIQ